VKRHIGIEIPKELLLCRDFQEAVPMFLRELCGGEGGKGLKMVYIVPGHRAWQSFCPPDIPDNKRGCWLAPYIESHVDWAMGKKEHLTRTCVMWEDIASPEAQWRRQGRHHRQFWWVGSGGAALALAEQWDIVQKNAFGAMNVLEDVVDVRCRTYWGDEFEGVEFLGWMGEELRIM
jgi:hypothetical protein